MAGYSYSDPFEGLIKGHDYVTGLFDQHARLQAGRAVAGGDLTGASGLLASRGMLGEAQKLRDQQTTQTALTAYNAGDTTGALTAAAKGGDTALYGSLDSAQAKDQAERAQWLGHAADALLQIPDETQRHAAFASSIAPVMRSMGVPDDQIAMIGNGQLTNENLTAFKATLGQVSSMSIQTTPDGDVIGIDPKTGSVKVLHHSEAKPIPSTGGAWVQDGGKWVFKQAPRTEKLGAGDTLVGIPGDGDGTAGTTGTPAGGSVGQGGFDAIYGTFVAPQEGGYTASDGNGAPANFGINQKANPDVDVKSLTADAARKIMHDRYWQPSGAEELPPALQAIQFDTAVNMGVGAARELLQQSGGDPEKYIQLREARYKAIAARDPTKASRLPNWLSRNAALRSYALGGDAGQPAGGDGVRVLARGAPKPVGHMATPEEKAALGFTGPAPIWINGDGEPQAKPTGDMTPRQVAAAATTLRKEFEQHPDVKQYQTVATQYDIISRLARSKPTAANDISQIFAYMKMLDPTSVVREGEFATAQNATGVPGAVLNAYNKAVSGQRLNPDQRRDFVEAASRIYDANKTRYDALVGQYQGYAEGMDLPASTIQPRAPVGGEPPAAARRTNDLSTLPVAMRQTIQRFKGSKDPAGSPGNPYTPNSEKEYNTLPSGAHYVYRDGTVRVKP